MNFAQNFCFHDCFGDERLDRRAAAMMEALVEHKTTIVRRFSSSQAERMAYYRLLNNEKVRPQSIIDELTGQCARHAESLGGEHLLVLTDSSEINLQAHVGRITPNSGLGRVGNNLDLGLFIQPALAVVAETGRCVGFSDIQYWTRQHEGSTTENQAYKQRPIEAKESYRWLTSVNQSRYLLRHASMLTVIADAEADIYEQYARVVDARTHLLIAARGDRRIVEGSGKLMAHLCEQPVLDTYTIELEGDRRKKHQRRSARVELRSARVHIRRPGNLPHGNDPATVELTAIYVKELAETIPAGSSGIDWMLLTTHELVDVEHAHQLIRWYLRRWNIEQLFRTLKRQGFNIEASQMEDGQSLIRLSLLALGAALQVMLLLLGRDGDAAQCVSDIFSEHEQACLNSINATLHGSSKASKNPHAAQTVAWATWIIARLGGWTALPSERPAGPITLFRGLKRFDQIYEGWRLARATP
jgi:hypothetical protein